MPISALDSLLFRNLFGTAPIRAIFDDKAYIRRCVDVEIALARAEARCGVIPSSAAEKIAAALAEGKLEMDFERLERETEVVGYPILPLVKQLGEVCEREYGGGEGGVGGYVHWGATTQDIQDSAAMLQIKAGLEIVDAHMLSLIATLERLSRKYRDVPMAGRTHMQHALPVTFGYKCAVYLSSMRRHLERLHQLWPRCLMVQFGGAAGTLASLAMEGEEDRGVKVRKALALELALQDPGVTWHTARDGIAEIINFLAMIGGTLGKIALDLIVMSSNEVGEVSEPFVPHRGASSTMPQKRNPISSEVILAASKLLRANAGLVMDAMVSDFERASGPWHLEWVAIPESFVVAVGALAQADFAMSGLVVNVGQMEQNLGSSRGLIVAEAVMMELAKHTGRQRAHDIVYEACKETIEAGEGKALFDVLAGKEEVNGAITMEKLKKLCEPANYLGAAGRMVDNVLAMHK